MLNIIRTESISALLLGGDKLCKRWLLPRTLRQFSDTFSYVARVLVCAFVNILVFAIIMVNLMFVNSEFFLLSIPHKMCGSKEKSRLTHMDMRKTGFFIRIVLSYCICANFCAVCVICF